MENNNEERNDVFYETPMYEQPKEEKKGGAGKVFAIILVILLVVVGGVFASGAASKLFATKGERFVQLLTVDQKILDIATFDNKNKQINSELKVDIDKMMEDVGSTSMGLGVFKLENKEIVKGDDFSESITMSLDSMEDLKIEVQIAKTGDLIGIHVPGITEKFIGVDVKDTEGLMKNLEELGMELEMEEDTEFTEKQQKELVEILEKYGNVSLAVLEEFIEKGSKVEIKADGKSDKATEYKLTINGEALVKTAVAVQKELLANEKDIDKFVELGLIAEDDKEEFIDSLKTSLEEFEKIVEEESFEDEFGDEKFIIKVYEKQGKNIATVFKFEDIEFGLYYFEPEKDSHSIVMKYEEGKNEMFITVDSTTEDNVTNSALKIKVDANGQEKELTLCETKVEKLNKIEDEIIKIKKDDILLLNTATEDDLEEFVESAVENAEEIFADMMPETPKNDYDFGYDYDYDYDEPAIDYKPVEKEENDPIPSSTGPQIASGKLATAQKLYNKVNCGMTKSEVIAAIGTPTDSFTGTFETLYYEIDDIEILSVSLENGKVMSVEIELRSSSYDNVYLSKDLGSTISDLNKIVGNVKEGMSLAEVEKILGNKYFESEKWDDGTFACTWYDTSENRLKIDFRNGKVDLVYNVYKMY